MIKNTFLRLAVVAVSIAVLVSGCSEGAGSSGAVMVERSDASLPQSSSAIPESPPAEAPLPESTPTPESKPELESKPAPESKPTPESKPAADSSVATPKFEISAESAKAGDCFTILGTGIPDGVTLKATATSGFEPKFYPDGDNISAFLPITRGTKPGSYDLTISYDGYSQNIPYTVLDPKFPSESFEMPESTVDSTVGSSTANKEFGDAIHPLYPVADDEFYGATGFIMPIKQASFRISSEYGFMRIVNDKVADQHTGVDFPAPAGTQVTATGDGRVLYAGLLQVTGNTVLIEHGHGLKSWYQHMSALDCKTGDTIKAGDPVGKVGTTGYSTGNHLHFGFSVNGTFTNPWQFVTHP